MSIQRIGHIELAFVLRKSGMKALFLWERDSRSDYKSILHEAMGAGEPRARARGLFWDGIVGGDAGRGRRYRESRVSAG